MLENTVNADEFGVWWMPYFTLQTTGRFLWFIGTEKLMN